VVFPLFGELSDDSFAYFRLVRVRPSQINKQVEPVIRLTTRYLGYIISDKNLDGSGLPHHESKWEIPVKKEEFDEYQEDNQDD
jgi:hypothetical protein